MLNSPFSTPEMLEALLVLGAVLGGMALFFIAAPYVGAAMVFALGFGMLGLEPMLGAIPAMLLALFDASRAGRRLRGMARVRAAIRRKKRAAAAGRAPPV